MHILADVAPTSPAFGLMIQVAGTIASLAVSLLLLMKISSGKDGERQIEPTAVAAIQEDLKAQTLAISKIDREMGGVISSVDLIKRELVEIRVNHRSDVTGLNARIDAISHELAGTAARVEGLEKREPSRRA